TVVLFKMKKDRYAWVTILPTVWLLICTTAAGLIKLFDSKPAVGFLAQARHYQAALANGELIGAAKTAGQMKQVILNSYVNAGLPALFLFVVFSTLVFAVREIAKARRSATPTVRETPYVELSDEQQKAWL